MAIHWDASRYHSQSDDSLRSRASRDRRCEIVRRCNNVLFEIDKIKAFVANPRRANADTIRVDLSDELGLIFRRTGDPLGWVELSVDCANVNEIIRCKLAIDAWRKRLAQWQGVTLTVRGWNKSGWLGDIFAQALLRLEERSVKGISKGINAEVARVLNEEVLTHLKQYVQDCAIYENAERNMTREEFDEWQMEMLTWPSEKVELPTGVPGYNNRLGVIRAMDLLELFRVEKPAEVCDDMIVRLRGGEDVAVMPNYPIGRTAVRERMRTWNDKNSAVFKKVSPSKR